MEETTLGPTGRFPNGKARPDDKGELRAAITDANGMVMIDFGIKVSWLAMTPEQAIEFAKLLDARARKVLGR